VSEKPNLFGFFRMLVTKTKSKLRLSERKTKFIWISLLNNAFVTFLLYDYVGIAIVSIGAMHLNESFA